MRILAVLPFVAACGSNVCMKPDYARSARVTSEYQLVVHSNETRREERGFGPERVTMHLYDAFACTPGSLKDSKYFYVELGPDCRLMAHVESHRRDTGRRYVPWEFIQSEASLLEGRTCALSLDDGRRIEGTVKNGMVLIRPATVQLDLAMSVPGGVFHLTQTGSWNRL